MSFFYIYECGLVVLCNLVIRKVIYMLEDSCYKVSELSYVSVLVVHMYLCTYLFSSVCIWSMFVFGTICKCSSIKVMFLIVYFLLSLISNNDVVSRQFSYLT